MLHRVPVFLYIVDTCLYLIDYMQWSGRFMKVNIDFPQ